MEPKEFRKISELTIWEKNPRSITKNNFNSLKKRLKRFGQFKPIIINKANMVVGGNMRLRAMLDIRKSHKNEDRKFMEINPKAFEDVWVSVVKAETEAGILEYSLADNELAGRWDEMQLAELLQDDWVDLKDRDYIIDRKKIDIQKLLDEYGPGDELSEEDLKGEEEKVTCPKCGHQFEI